MIKNGQLANETNLNAAFASKSAANSLNGILNLAAELSGEAVTNVQQTINDLLLSASNTANDITSLQERVTVLEAPKDEIELKTFAYFQDKVTDGSFRIGLEAGAFVIQKLVAGTWQDELKFNP